MSSASTPRYVRHRTLFSDHAWNTLMTTSVVVVGCGGLGSNVLEALSRLAPLDLHLWDPGILDEPDLNRQILYTAHDLGRPKVERAAEVLSNVNPDLSITTHPVALTSSNFIPPDRSFVVFDCLDSFQARAALEWIRSHHQVPVFHGGAEGWCGQVHTFLPDSKGYADVFGPDYARIGPGGKPILSPTVATIAAAQVNEFVHWCHDPQTPLSGKMLIYNGKTMDVDFLTVG